MPEDFMNDYQKVEKETKEITESVQVLQKHLFEITRSRKRHHNIFVSSASIGDDEYLNQNNHASNQSSLNNSVNNLKLE